MVDTQIQESVEYARALWSNIIDWYKNADSKAQVLLGLDGAFLSFLTGSVFKKPEELTTMLRSFGPETWGILLLMGLSLIGSIVSALWCLRSRLSGSKELSDLFQKLGVDRDKAETYRPEVMYFFQLIGQLDKEQLQSRMITVTKAFEVQALASQIVDVSKNVTAKHLWVNRGFVLSGTSLILFMLAGISYLYRVSEFAK